MSNTTSTARRSYALIISCHQLVMENVQHTIGHNKTNSAEWTKDVENNEVTVDKQCINMGEVGGKG